MPALYDVGYARTRHFKKTRAGRIFFSGHMASRAPRAMLTYLAAERWSSANANPASPSAQLGWTRRGVLAYGLANSSPASGGCRAVLDPVGPRIRAAGRGRAEWGPARLTTAAEALYWGWQGANRHYLLVRARGRPDSMAHCDHHPPPRKTSSDRYFGRTWRIS